MTSESAIHPTAVATDADTGAGTVGGLALAAARREGDALTAPGSAPISYPELGRAVRDIAGGLAALGIARGDHVAILAGTRPEWTLADLGALCAGATVVPIYQTNSPEECEYILAHAGVRAIFCEDAEQVAKIAQVREGCPALEHIIVFDGMARGASRWRPCAPEARRRATRSSPSGSPASARATSPRSSTHPGRPGRRRAA